MKSDSAPKWAKTVILCLFCLTVAWMINDLRIFTKQKLSEISERTLVIATTGKEVAGDVSGVRAVLGLPNGSRDNTLTSYTQSLMDLIEAQADATIGVGEKMKDAVSVSEWSKSARQEALVLLWREHSRENVLFRLSRTWPLRKEYYIQLKGEAPQALEAWVRAHHPESTSLPPAEE